MKGHAAKPTQVRTLVRVWLECVHQACHSGNTPPSAPAGAAAEVERAHVAGPRLRLQSTSGGRRAGWQACRVSGPHASGRGRSVTHTHTHTQSACRVAGRGQHTGRHAGSGRWRRRVYRSCGAACVTREREGDPGSAAGEGGRARPPRVPGGRVHRPAEPTHFICLTMVLLPDSPAPGKRGPT